MLDGLVLYEENGNLDLIYHFIITRYQKFESLLQAIITNRLTKISFQVVLITQQLLKVLKTEAIGDDKVNNI